jgi:hypothetical protein
LANDFFDHQNQDELRKNITTNAHHDSTLLLLVAVVVIRSFANKPKMNQRRRTVKVPADLLGVDSTSIQESFFQQSPVPRLSPLHQQEEDNEEKYEFFLNCHTPNSRCSTITMDIFSMDEDGLSVSEEEESRQPTSLVWANQHRSDTSDSIEKRLTLPIDEENVTYITMTSSSSYTEDFKDAVQSAGCNTPYTYKTIDSKEISCEDTNELHGDPNLSYSMHTRYTYETIQSHEATTPNCIGKKKNVDESTPYEVKSADTIGHLKGYASPIMQSLDCFSIDLYNSSPDMSENHFSIDSYSSSLDRLAFTHSSIERARSRRDQALCKLQRLEKKFLGEHDTSTPKVLSLRENGCGLSERLVQMEIQRQRLSHAVHTYCHHTKTET